MLNTIPFIGSILDYKLGGPDLLDWLRVLGLALLGWFVGFCVSFVLKRIHARIERKLSIYGIVIGSLSRPIQFLCVVIGLYIGLLLLPAGENLAMVLSHVFVVLKALSVWVFIWVLLIMTDGFAQRFLEHAETTDSKIDDMLTPIIATMVKFLLIAMGVLLILQNMGYSITSLIAGLGLGGAAVALAAKDTIANVFGSLVVFLDKPFELGDWIDVNGVEGSVEEIRLRTTVIRTFDNTVVTMPNSLLTNTNVNNFARRVKRRMDCSFGVQYYTKADQLEAIIRDVKKYLTENSETYAEPHWVAFDGFGDYSLDVSVTAYSHTIDKAEHMAVKQECLFAIMRIIESHGSNFAYPTRTIDIREMPAMSPLVKSA
ncbi:MAG: mechanosensitive ion channel family protein [Bradymonadales bacterium]|jgi:MscS family membrane protein